MWRFRRLLIKIDARKAAAMTQFAMRVFRPSGSRPNKKRPVHVSACPLPLFDAAQKMCFWVDVRVIDQQLLIFFHCIAFGITFG
jgi:hypothetical protein